ncbi:hypothetical protein NKH77_27745 [Streptomyces sp. M19]
MALAGGTVAAGGHYGGAAWSLDGAARWVPDREETCHDTAYAGEGAKLVALHECDEPESAAQRVITLNPRRGPRRRRTRSTRTSVTWTSPPSTRSSSASTPTPRWATTPAPPPSSPSTTAKRAARSAARSTP